MSARCTLLCLALAACSSPELPPLQLETTHFRYHGRTPPTCSGLGEWLEHHYQTMSAALGVELPAGGKIDIHTFADSADLAENGCGAIQGVEPTGCADGTDTYSVQEYDPHELIHAYASLLGDPPLFFKEGLAETLGCGIWADDLAIERPADVRPLLTTAGFRKLQGAAFFAAYGATADLTRWLIDVHGMGPFLAFYANTPEGAGWSELEASFQAHVGGSLEAAIAAWEASPPRTRGGVCLHLAECATPPFGDAGGTEVAHLACGPAVSPTTALAPLAIVRSFALPAPRRVTLHLAGDRPMSARLRSCNSELHPAQHVTFLDGKPGELWTELPAGDYWLAAYAAGADPGPGEVAPDTAVRLDLGAGEATTCAASPRAVAPETVEVVLRGAFSLDQDVDPADGTPDLSFPFTIDQPATLGIRTYSSDGVPYDGESAALCQGTCPGAGTCATGTLGQAPNLPFAGAPLTPGTVYDVTLQGRPGALGAQLGLRFLR